MYKNIIFDADGTLLDSLPGIMAGFNYALEKRGMTPLTAKQVRPFMGPSIMDSLVTSLGFSKEDAKKALDDYREFYWDKGYKMCKFYDGIPSLLDNLKKDGKILCVATNKPQPFIELILKEKGYFDYFTVIAGADVSETTTDKTPLVKKANIDPSSVMVGDRYVDIIAAKKVGIDSIGVLWGAAEDGEFEIYPPTHIAKDMTELYKIITK